MGVSHGPSRGGVLGPSLSQLCVLPALEQPPDEGTGRCPWVAGLSTGGM